MPGHRRSLPQGSQPDLAEAEVQVPLSFHKAWHGLTLLEALGVGYFFAILFWTPRPPRNPPLLSLPQDFAGHTTIFCNNSPA